MKKKNIFIKSTIILILGGVITKILGFIIRIIYTRIVGAEVIGLYSLVMPTYSLLITIATLALPTTISKLIAEGNHNNVKIVSTSTILIMLINLVVVIFMLISAKFIAINLLHEERCYLLIISMALTFPIISISSIIKGYYYGKQNMIPNVVSNVIEQVIRGLLIYIFVPIIMKKSEILAACSLFLFSFIEELVSIIVNLLFLPKNIKINKVHLKPDKYTLKNILNISLPTVSSRIIGNIGYFFEPIILKNLLLFSGYSNNYILVQYGAYNAYTITILTVPSFFITAISSALIPEISKHYLDRSNNLLLKRLKEALFFSLIIGISYSVLLMFFGSHILNAIYNTNLGLSYIKVLAPIFPLFYIESILMSFLQAINKASITMRITIIGVIIKLVVLAITSLLHIGLYSLIISEIVNIFVVVSLNIYYVRKYTKEL
ncbi:MAG: oligosaccharide flippase family protein [Bacilli bacterium]|nr:oligosaccharide flippase family protein [Bacilli bacterium]